MFHEENHPQYFTATIYEWQALLKDDRVKDSIIKSLQFIARYARR